MDQEFARLQLKDAGRKYARLQRARDDLFTAVVAAVETGMRPSEIVELSGYNREHVRRIANGWRPKRPRNDVGPPP